MFIHFLGKRIIGSIRSGISDNNFYLIKRFFNIHYFQTHCMKFYNGASANNPARLFKLPNNIRRTL